MESDLPPEVVNLKLGALFPTISSTGRVLGFRTAGGGGRAVNGGVIAGRSVAGRDVEMDRVGLARRSFLQGHHEVLGVVRGSFKHFYRVGTVIGEPQRPGIPFILILVEVDADRGWLHLESLGNPGVRPDANLLLLVDAGGQRRRSAEASGRVGGLHPYPKIIRLSGDRFHQFELEGILLGFGQGKPQRLFRVVLDLEDFLAEVVVRDLAEVGPGGKNVHVPLTFSAQLEFRLRSRGVVGVDRDRLLVFPAQLPTVEREREFPGLPRGELLGELAGLGAAAGRLDLLDLEGSAALVLDHERVLQRRAHPRGAEIVNGIVHLDQRSRAFRPGGLGRLIRPRFFSSGARENGGRRYRRRCHQYGQGGRARPAIPPPRGPRDGWSR